MFVKSKSFTNIHPYISLYAKLLTEKQTNKRRVEHDHLGGGKQQ